MPYFEFFWTEDNAAHVGEHGIELDEFEEVVQAADRISIQWQAVGVWLDECRQVHRLRLRNAGRYHRLSIQ